MRILALLLAAFALNAQTTKFSVITASHIQDVSGAPLASGKICAQGVYPSTGAPLNFHAGAGGIVATTQVCAIVTNGVIIGTLRVPDSNFTAPLNVAYTLTVTDVAHNGGLVIKAGPTQITGDTWSLDDYQPIVNPPLALINQGVQGPPGPAGGGANTPATSNVLVGTGVANGVKAGVPNTDYLLPNLSSVVGAIGFTPQNAAAANTHNDALGAAAAAQSAAVTAANAAASSMIAALNLASGSQKAAVTAVGSPGADTNVPTEKAVRAAIVAQAAIPNAGNDALGAATAAQAAAITASAQRAANLSDLVNAATARTNLGLGTAATQPSTAFDVSGAAATAQAAAIAASDPTGSATAAQTASAQKSANLSDLASATTARTNLGLGTAATQASTAFDASGAAAAAQAAAIAAAAAGNTTGTAAKATAAATIPTLCPTGQVPTGITSTFNATGCAVVGGASTPATSNVLIGTGVANGVAAGVPNVNYLPVASPVITGSPTINGNAAVDASSAQTITTKKISDTYTVGVSGVTANLLVARDTSLSSRAVLPALGGCGFGVALTTAASGTATIQYGGIATLVADNAIAAGDLVGGSTTTPGRAIDLFSQVDAGVPSTTCIVGKAQSSAAAGGTFSVLLSPGVHGTQLSALAPLSVPNSIPVNTSAAATRAAVSSDVTALFSCSSGFLDSTGTCSFPTKLTGQAVITTGIIPDVNIVTLGTTITVSGAVPGNSATVVSVSPALPSGVEWPKAFVSAANTVSIQINNGSGGPITPAATTFRVMVDTAPANINAADFGAVADGVTDTTAALVSAINAACATGGKVVLGPGVYFLNSYSIFPGSGLTNSYHNLPLCNNLEIDGQGINQTTLMQGPAGQIGHIGATFLATPTFATPYASSFSYQQTTGPGALNGSFYPMNQVVVGDNCELTTTPSDAANFHVGDYAYIVSFWTASSFQNFIESQPDLVTSVNTSTGQICFKYPMARTFTNGIQTAAYQSGGTFTGTTGQLCAVNTFNAAGGSGASGFLALTSANTVAPGTPVQMVVSGLNYTGTPTTANVANSQATCSGTINVTGTIGSAFIRNVTPTTTHNVTIKNLTIQSSVPESLSEIWYVNHQNVNLVIDTTQNTDAIKVLALFYNTTNGLNYNNVNLSCLGTTADCYTTSPARLSNWQLFSRNSAENVWQNSSFATGGLFFTSENSMDTSFINDSITLAENGANFSGANIQVIGGSLTAGGVAGVTYTTGFAGVTDAGGGVPGDYTTFNGLTVNCNLVSGGYCTQVRRATSSMINSTINVNSSLSWCGLLSSATQDGGLSTQQVTGNTCHSSGNSWQLGNSVAGGLDAYNFSKNTLIGNGTGGQSVLISPTFVPSASSSPTVTNNNISGFTGVYNVAGNARGVAITSPATDIFANLGRYGSAPVIITNGTTGSNPCTVGSSTVLATPTGPGTWTCQ